MKITKLFLVLGVVLALGLMVGPAFAVTADPVDPLGDGIEEIYDGLVPVATIYYTADFEVVDYILSETISHRGSYH